MTTDPTRSIEDFVLDFHKVFGHPSPEALDMGTPQLRKLRAELIREELIDELLPALGLSYNPDDEDPLFFTYDGLNPAEPDIVETADALTDILWVTIGAMIAFGMPVHALMAEVWASNMTKLGEDGKPIYRADGKIVKGPNYLPPNIRRVLEMHA